MDDLLKDSISIRDSWTAETLDNLIIKIIKITNKPLILVDGIAGSGKTSLAVKIASLLNANLVHTDDVCWCADIIKWDGEMIDGIITPWLKQMNVSYRPTGWILKNRPGSIDVDPNKALIVEGVSASRKILRSYAAYSIWVDIEPEIARNRVIQRDIANGNDGGTEESITQFSNWWDSIVNPFLLEEKPWNYVDIIVSGTQSDLNSNNLMVHIPEKIISI